jgi:hypothetical protein
LMRTIILLIVWRQPYTRRLDVAYPPQSYRNRHNHLTK